MSFFDDPSPGAGMIRPMVEILHDAIPADLEHDASLPGIRPLEGGRWLHCDETYAAQMAYRRELIERRRDQVICESEETRDATQEALDEALQLLPAQGFGLTARHIYCPDGQEIDRESDSPLAVLGRSVQEDICILQKQGDEHVLTAAIVCFPASWTLREKIGRPLTDIHIPVDHYDDHIAKRVQRLFDGVQVGRPLWRNNMLKYSDPDLHQPRVTAEVRTMPDQDNAQFYLRAERQCILRLPKTGAVVFSIHTYVARAGQQVSPA